MQPFQCNWPAWRPAKTAGPHSSVSHSLNFPYWVSYPLKCQGSLWRMRISLFKWRLLKVILSVGRSAGLKWHVSSLQPSKRQLLKVFCPFNLQSTNATWLVASYALVLQCIDIFKKITDLASIVMSFTLNIWGRSYCVSVMYLNMAWDLLRDTVILFYHFVFKCLSMLLCWLQERRWSFGGVKLQVARGSCPVILN